MLIYGAIFSCLEPVRPPVPHPRSSIHPRPNPMYPHARGADVRAMGHLCGWRAKREVKGAWVQLEVGRAVAGSCLSLVGAGMGTRGTLPAPLSAPRPGPLRLRFLGSVVVASSWSHGLSLKSRRSGRGVTVSRRSTAGKGNADQRRGDDGGLVEERRSTSCQNAAAKRVPFGSIGFVVGWSGVVCAEIELGAWASPP